MTTIRRLPLVATIVSVLAVAISTAPAYAASVGAEPVLAVSKKPIAVVGVIVIVLVAAGVGVWYVRRNR